MSATAEKDTGLAVRVDISPETVLMFERLAANPDVDVAKLEKLIEMQERILRHNAEAAFNAAFAQMQPMIPTIGEKRATDKGTYAPREDIVDVIRPILSANGFTLSFQTEWPDPKTVRVIGVLTHIEGHSRRSEFLSGADTSGSKNAIQALGSAVEYGRRYTTTDLLNIVTRKADDDGKRAGQSDRPETPDGYDDWLTDMTAAADNGYKTFAEAWNKSPKPFRDFVNKHDKQAINQMRAKAGAK